ncbi:hypothetical protein ACHAWF_016257 [Thalassiosira exigua]
MQSLPSCMLSLPSYMPTLKRATMAHEKQKRETQQTYPNSSFERMLLLLSLAISVMTSYSAFFSMEEEKQESKPSSPKDCNVRKDDINDDRRNGFHRRKKSSGDNTMSQGPFVLTSEWGVYVLALFFSAVVMNDAMYALAFPRSNLIAMHIFFIYLSMKRFGSKKAFKTTFPITAVAFYIMSGQQHDLPAIEPGLYYDETNRFISRVVKHWPVDKRTYDDGRGTPWMITGDTRTGLPFMVNKIPKLNFVRRWVPLHEEEEAVILDIALPEIVDNDTKVYLVLHGINGDSNEGYVVDFASRQVSEGNIVAVMVTRGLGDSPIVNGNILHFARLSDVRAAARALRNAINQVNPNLLLAGVGYSMGAITLANYVAQSNPTDIDVAVAFSGALDTTQQVKFSRSVSLWQPFIAKAMRDTLLSRYTNEISQRLDHEQLKETMMAKSLVEFDDAFFVPYHNFDSLEDYYSRMGAMADFDTNGYLGRIANVSIPLLSVSSLDDPIAYWKAYHDPSQVSKAGAGNNVLLFTETGGHVGWPLGWNPANHGWRWMSDVASSFVESVDHAHKHPSLE